MSEFRLAKLTWPEIKDMLPNLNAVLIPVGSTEQHGRQMPMDNDYSTSVTYCERIAEQAWKEDLQVLVTPPIAFGVSWYHMDFPGTISLSQRTFMDIVKQVCGSLIKHGFKNIILFNSHGGNSPALTVALTEIYEETRYRVQLVQWWNFIGGVFKERGVQTPLTHAEEAETSMALALGQRVRMDELTKACFNRKEVLEEKGIPTSKHINYDMLTPGSGVVTPMDFIADISETGVVGDATLANKELGEMMVKSVVSSTVDFIHDLNK